MEGEIFSPTGINKAKLWLHYNFLPDWDQPAPNKPHVPPYVFLTEALELCRTISDVEALILTKQTGMAACCCLQSTGKITSSLFSIAYVQNIIEGSHRMAGWLEQIIIAPAKI